MLRRRDLMLGAGAVAALGAVRARAATGPTLDLGPAFTFDFDWLQGEARQLAARAYEAPVIRYPDILESIDYDAYQQIQFKPERALWADGGAPFPVQFFHLGRYFKAPVRLYVVEGGSAREIRYTTDVFTFGKTHLDQRLPSDLGFAGFRVMDGPGATNATGSPIRGRSYFRDLRRARSIRPVGARPRDRYRHAVAGGVPALHPVLARADPAGELAHPDLRAHGQPERRRRLSLRLGQARGRGGRHAGPSCTAARRSGAWAWRRSPACSGSARPTAIRRPTGAPRSTTATAWRSGPATASGCGGRSTTRRACAPAPSSTTIRRASVCCSATATFYDYEDDGVFYDRRPSVWVEPLGDWGRVRCSWSRSRPTTRSTTTSWPTGCRQAPVQAGVALVVRLSPALVGGRALSPGQGRAGARDPPGRGGIPGQPRPKGARKFVIDFAGGPLPILRRATRSCR